MSDNTPSFCKAGLEQSMFSAYFGRYPSLLLSVTAFVALVRFNIGVIPLLAVCASLGFVVKQWLY